MILQIAWKDLKSAFKERTLISIVALQLFVALFASVITFGLLVLYSPGATGYAIEKDVRVGLVGDAPVLRDTIDPYSTYDSLDAALDDFYDGRIDSVVLLTEEKYSDTNYVRVILPKEEIKAIQSSLLLKERLKEYEEKMRSMRDIPPSLELKTYNTQFKEIEVPESVSITYEFIYILLIPLLVITTAATSAGMFIDLISEEKETKTAHVLLSTPVGEQQIVQGKMLSSVLLTALLTPTWIILLILNGIEIANIPLVILLSISISLIFLAISALSVTISRDRERAQLVFSLLIVGIIPLMFSSPELPAILTSRIAAGSPFSMGYVGLYLLMGVGLVLAVSRSLQNIFTDV